MTELDDTDLIILQRLLDDARRSYRGIADEVDLSPPTVSNRVDRLRELGVIRRFTLQLDRSMLSGPDESLLVVRTNPDDAGEVASTLAAVEGVEHVFRTVEGRVVAKAVLSTSDVHSLFTNTLDGDRVEEYRVDAVVDSTWRPQLDSGEFDLQCSVCGNGVSDEGETVEVDSGHRHRVCCSSCASRIAEEYRSIRQTADG